MNNKIFLDDLKQSGISHHNKFFKEFLRPSIDILKNIDKPTKVGESRFGGFPDLPIDEKWPKYKNRLYRFLCQINFSEIDITESNLPKNGLLSIFFHEHYLNFWEDGYIKAIFVPKLIGLKTIRKPKIRYKKEVAIEFLSTVDIPYSKYQVSNWPFDDDEEIAYSNIREKIHKSEDYLLGYPSHRTLAYDLTPNEKWISLLTIDSDDYLEWCWNDFDKLMIFIRKDDLKNLNFNNLKVVAG